MNKPRRATVVATVAAWLVTATAVPAARAGDIWVTDGNMNAGQTGGCGAFGVYGDFSVFSIPNDCPMMVQAGSIVGPGQNAYWMTTAPSGITITSAWTAQGDVSSYALDNGWVVGDFWQDAGSGQWGGSTLASGQTWFNTGVEGATGSLGINSHIYGVQLLCARSAGQGSCLGLGPPSFGISGIELHGVENTGPSVSGGGSLWADGGYVWNPPGDSWSVTLSASDPSGICSSSATVNGVAIHGPSEPVDPTVWQQCPNPVSWSFPVDTRSEVPGDGSFGIGLDALNAAAVDGSASPAKTVYVDNDPIRVSFQTPNDPNPSVWVNHAVTVHAAATTGPSGLGGMNCNVDNTASRSYPAAGLTLDGDGVHSISCSAWNQAIDPQGDHNTGSNTLVVRVDEAPPDVSFEPQDPSDPTRLLVDTSDSESGAAGGSVEMAPAGTSAWTSLPTSFDGSHLLTRFDDAGLRGSYDFRATSCDNVGNCGTTTERLALPLRLASDSQVSLTRIIDPLRRRVVAEQVRVGWHWVTVRRGDHMVRVKRGGHLQAVKVVRYVEQCSTKRVRTGPHSWQIERVCRHPKVRVTSTLLVPYGHTVTLDGLDTTGQGAPIANQTVHILAAPNDQSGSYTQLATATTARDGSWSATLPPGPSRTIRAVTDGTATILPSAGQVTTVVPARIRLLEVWPRQVPWGGTVHLVGRLFGGYLPPGGALVRLRIGYGSTYSTYGVQEHVTGDGRFSTVASFGPGDPSVHRTYWFQIASLPMGNYPYAPAASQRVPVIVGGHPQPGRRPASKIRRRPTLDAS